MTPSPLGARIQVSGMTCSGKTTLATRLGRTLDLPYTDLDAIFWLPGWTEPDDEDWQARLANFAAGERWIVSGNYFRHTGHTLWPRLQTLIWLDLPLHLLLRRVVVRSWRRWRSHEILWDANEERFWPHLKVWDQKDSLIAYALFGRKRLYARIRAAMADPATAHIRIVRLRTVAEVEAFARAVEANTRA